METVGGICRRGRRFFAVLEDELMGISRGGVQGMRFSEEEIIHLFYDKFYQIPLLKEWMRLWNILLILMRR